jgi:6-phosphogluconate dehydrogenase
MQLGVVGLGRMGSGIARRLMRGGHRCVVYDTRPDAVAALAKDGAKGAASLEEFVRQLELPRAIWIMLPAGDITEGMVEELGRFLAADDIIIDGGNTFYRDDMRRADTLRRKNIHYVDVGTSGGVFGFERGFCLMIGGDTKAVERLAPIFSTLAPGTDAAPRTRGRSGSPTSTEHGFLHCGPAGAGHFVKMVHNGIEYGLMAAYAEGLAILKSANVGQKQNEADAETTPLRNPEDYRYEFNLTDVAEVWRRGSVIASWLLDLTANALAADPQLSQFAGRVSDSGEGRWTIKAAIDEGVPVPVLTTALYERFASRGEADFQDKLLSAMRFGFGGHLEKPTP